ncbi:hypothetical protein SDC9_188430 [bioreactor metagenome]|uniref:Uncharacterized protein n=1 Tax=bioreactor metagenome TaxID=1076179 RepID=A0A645HPW8_9ZZZZ
MQLVLLLIQGLCGGGHHLVIASLSLGQLGFAVYDLLFGVPQLLLGFCDLVVKGGLGVQKLPFRLVDLLCASGHNIVVVDLKAVVPHGFQTFFQL